MTQIFLAILLTSAIGTAFALMLTLLKPVTRKVFSGGWHYYMWLVVLIVMILPVRLNLPEKSVGIPPVSETVEITDNKAENIETYIIDTQTELITPEQPIQPEKVSTVQTIKDFLSGKVLLFSFVWLMGAALLFLIKIVSYIIFLIKMHRHSDVISCSEVEVYTKRKIKTRVSDAICSPLVIGIIRPTLLLPKADITPEQLQNVLAHEMTHVRRNDILYKWFVSFVKCVHWFNPAIYFISKQINIDCEISCDLAVVKEMNEQQKKDYVETILALLTHNNSKAIPLTTGMTGNKKTLKKRFTMIKDKFKMNKKATVISIVVAIVLLISAIVISGLTNGFFVEGKPDDKILYKNESLNIQFEIPLGWKDKYIVDESAVDEGYIAIKHKAIAEKHNGMGTLFYIHKYRDDELEEILHMVGGQTVLWQNEEYAYVLGRPSDVQVPIWADSDEEDLALAEDYKAMEREIELIEKTFGLIKDAPVPVIENAENLSYMQIRDLQRQANNGHLPWRIDYEQVVMAFLSGKGIDVDGGKVTALAGSSNNISLTYSVDGKDYSFDMFRPIDKTEQGIWVVKTFQKKGSNSEQQKFDIINNSLKDGEEILPNSGDKWVVTEKQVKAVLDKISEKRQMKLYSNVQGNYEIFIYSVWSNDSDVKRIFIINTDKQELILSTNLDANLYSDVVNLLEGDTQKAVSDPSNTTSLNEAKITVTDIGCDDIKDTDYVYEYFIYEKYDVTRQCNLTLSKKDGTISFYYKSDKKQSIGVKLIEMETGDIDAEYTITPEPNKIYTFNGLKSDASYEIVLDGQINEPVYIIHQKYGEYTAPALPVVQEDGIGFSQIVFENDTSIKDIESNLKKSGKTYTVSDYSYKDSLSSTKSNITCDKNGNISVFFDINAENLVDVTFKDSATKKEVAKFGILANNVNSYSFTGFDKNKKYDVIVQGKTKNNWKIEGQYIIF